LRSFWRHPSRRLAISQTIAILAALRVQNEVGRNLRRALFASISSSDSTAYDTAYEYVVLLAAPE
jgi:hypothetical protein